ncbi:MAG TPA: DUF2007 domain-containing protein [Bacteroidales bacterium]|nr:DUF2007 domain-containing protein [Bacteroidales bacterium]
MEPIEVFAGTTMHAQMLKSILNDSEIEAFLKGEVIGSMAPWYTGPGGFASVKVMVSKNDYEKAMLVVAEFEKNIKQE